MAHIISVIKPPDPAFKLVLFSFLSGIMGIGERPVRSKDVICEAGKLCSLRWDDVRTRANGLRCLSMIQRLKKQSQVMSWD